MTRVAAFFFCFLLVMFRQFRDSSLHSLTHNETTLACSGESTALRAVALPQMYLWDAFCPIVYYIGDGYMYLSPSRCVRVPLNPLIFRNT
jgi:hypothetical protein